MKSEKLWNKLAKNWDTPGVSLGENDLRIIERTKKYLNASSVILDYGCATGSMALEIASMAKEVRGIDISLNMIEIARRKADEQKIKNIGLARAAIFDESLEKESLELNKLNVHHWFFSTDLTHYKRGGRISAVSTTMGALLNICPLMNMNHEGKLIPREKRSAAKNTSLPRL